MSRTRTVVFAGENPLLQLHRPDGEEIVAVASLWRGDYSEHGAGFALVLWVDPELLDPRDQSLTGIFTDNTDLARLVWTNFSQHFGPFKNRGIESSEPRPARFVEVGGCCYYHRVICSWGATTIELLWQDAQDVFHHVDTATVGDATWEIANVVAPCARGAILVNGTPISGEARPIGGIYQSSAFLAFCETWIRLS